MNKNFKFPKLSKLNGVPQSFEGKFFGLPFKLINQYTIDNKVEILFYDNRPKGEIVAIIKDNSQLDMIIDSVASWLFKNEDITNLSSYNEKDLKEVHKRLKPFLFNLLQEVKKYNKKPVTKAIKPEKDKATIQKLTNSLKEGELIIRSGKINNRKLDKEELKAVERTVNNTRKKLGIKKTKTIKPVKNKIVPIENKYREETKQQLINSIKDLKQIIKSKPGVTENVYKQMLANAQLDLKKGNYININRKVKTLKKPRVKKIRQSITTSAKQTGTSNLLYDKRKKAKAPGKRISESGNTYYEYRRNRSDLPGSLTGLYFKKSEILSLDDLKKVYKNLAKKLHPDKGGDTASFQAMQNEYDLLVNEILKTGNLSAQQVKNEVELDEIYKEIINVLIPYENLNIEIIGTWIWLSGSFNDLAPLTKKYGNGLLDSLGFKWASLKKMYYLDTTGKGTKNKKEMSIESIRNKYGTKEIKTGKAKLNGIEDKNLINLFKKLKLRLKKRKGYLTKI